MTQERITSLRILPNNKKKILSPVMYLLIGFILGLLFAALIFWVFIIDSSTPKANMLQINKEYEFIQPDSKETLANSDAHITAHQTIEIQSEAIESEEDNNFIQPASHDLNKFFQHAPVAAPSPTGQQSSPFANEPKAKSVSTAAPENLSKRHNKTVPKAVDALEKIVTPKTMPENITESDPETPAASLKITVTQKTIAANEAQ